MPMLSDTKIRAAKAKGKPFKLFDAEGLFLIVHPSGGRWWRQRYFWAGKEQLISLGVYPEISLATAREKGDAVRRQVANGVNPSIHRQEQKVARHDAAERSFQAVALQWLERTGKAREWTADHMERSRRRLDLHIFPWVGRKHIAEVTDDDILACLRRMEDRNLIDTAHRARAECDATFRYARRLKYVKHNPVADLRGEDTLPRVKVKHHAAITDPGNLAALLRAIDNYPGGFAVKCAMQFLPLVFVRPGEMQWSVWSEFDLDGAEWRIPAARMKIREYHLVPLSRQAIAILRELHPLTGPDGFVFPQVRNASRPISENTLNVALRACGFGQDQQTAHGFRTTASTLLNEQGKWSADAIERQLAHGERNKIRGAYNAAQYLPERRKMMQAWADYLDELRVAANSDAPTPCEFVTRRPGLY
jgi:integrase